MSFRVRRCPDCKTLRLDTPGPCFHCHQLAERSKPAPPQRPKPKPRRYRPPASIATLLGRWDREHGEPPAEPERFNGCGGEPAYRVYMRAYRGESHASRIRTAGQGG